MKEKFKRSLLLSLEWRLYAFIITGIFLWVTTGHFLTATALAFGLQIILLIGHSIWLYFRSGHTPHAAQ